MIDDLKKKIDKITEKEREIADVEILLRSAHPDLHERPRLEKQLQSLLKKYRALRIDFDNYVMTAEMGHEHFIWTVPWIVVTQPVSSTVSFALPNSEDIIGSPVRVGIAPFEVAFAPLRIFVKTKKGISVINKKTKTVEKEIPISCLRSGNIAVTPDFKKAYVASEDCNVVTVIDLTILDVSKVFGVENKPSRIVMAPDGKFAYVFSYYDTPSITAIDTSTDTIAGKITSAKPMRIGNLVCSPDNSRIYFTEMNENKLYAIEPFSKSSGTISGGNIINTTGICYQSWNIRLTPDGKTAYISVSSHQVDVYDLPGMTLNVSIDTGTGSSPYEILFTPDSKKAFVIARIFGSKTTSVIRISTRTMNKKTLTINDFSWAEAITPDGSKIFFRTTNGIYVLTTVSYNIRKILTTITYPDRIAVG